MKRFIRFCLLLCLPIIPMLVFYIAIDPFKVVWHYDAYYTTDNFVGLNRGFVSAMTYANQHDEYGYDSYIFGNSRCIAYYEAEWKKYLPQASVCYHFDASGGSVGELYYAIRYISEHGTINNALLILDYDLLSQTERDGVLFSCPPILKRNKNLLSFHKTYFSTFYKYEFFKAFMDYRIHNEYKPYMGDYIINPKRPMGYKPINNELNWDIQEKSIDSGIYYTAERLSGFADSQYPGQVSESVLDDERQEMLRGIKSAFDKQKTDYRIIISPIFNQIKINPEDLRFLSDVFGEDYVFDFSGVNKWNSDFHNYYETSHYRPCVANELMRIAYADR